jgi:hypothetical protein
MNKYRQPQGPRCVVCGKVYQPRVLRDGSMSQTCGQTACVSTHTRRKNASHTPVNKPNIPKKKPSFV